MAMRAAYDNAAKDAGARERLYREDPGPSRCVAWRWPRPAARPPKSQVAAAEADVRRAIEAAGESGDDNSQLLSARSAVHKAELDRQNTRVVAPGRGSSPTSSTDAGQFIGVGARPATLIAIHDVWVSYDLTGEQSRQHSTRGQGRHPASTARPDSYSREDPQRRLRAER